MRTGYCGGTINGYMCPPCKTGFVGDNCQSVRKVLRTLLASVKMQAGVCERQTPEDVRNNVRSVAAVTDHLSSFDLPNSVGVCSNGTDATRQRRVSKDRFDVKLAFHDHVSATTISQVLEDTNARIATGQFNVKLSVAGSTFTSSVMNPVSQATRTIVVFETLAPTASVYATNMSNGSSAHRAGIDQVSRGTANVSSTELPRVVFPKASATVVGPWPSCALVLVAVASAALA